MGSLGNGIGNLVDVAISSAMHTKAVGGETARQRLSCHRDLLHYCFCSNFIL